MILIYYIYKYIIKIYYYFFSLEITIINSIEIKIIVQFLINKTIIRD